jgi:hypothetical protein
MSTKDKPPVDVQDEWLESEEKTKPVAIAIDESNQPRYDSKEVKVLLRKLDWRILPILTFLYLVSFLDRGNIGNAKVRSYLTFHRACPY